MQTLNLSLHGKRALVTGASSGLGAHFAQVLAAHGAEVVLAARRAEALAAVQQQIEAFGGKAQSVQLDVNDAASRERLLPSAGRIDILVNNAGIVRDAPALDQSVQDWQAVIETNLSGMFYIAQQCGRAMRETGGGSIINIASILGLRQAGGVLPYAVSKAGVIQMSKSLALETARYKVRVNALAPGYLDTDLNRSFFASPAGAALIKRIPQRRLGRLDDLNGPLLLLASDASAYMSGAVIAVDGGHLVSSL